MKKFSKFFGFMFTTLCMILFGGNFSMAAAGDLAGDAAVTGNVGPLDGPGHGVQGANTLTASQEIMEGDDDLDFYLKQVNKRIVEMKMESCPIDQILRAQNRVNKSNSVRVEYYAVGQRPIASTLAETVNSGNATSSGTATTIKVTNASAFDNMDVIMFPEIMGYKADGETRETKIPLQVRVVGMSGLNPQVIAINGKKHTSNNNRWDLPAGLVAGTKMLRLGRAAGEKDVETASYYELPEASLQYCQRYIMQCEQSIIERMSAKKVDWTFSRQERSAMDDMRGGIERSGLFGFKNITRYGTSGNIYTTNGIFWEAGKDIDLGHWAPKLDEAGNAITVTYDAFSTSTNYAVGDRVTYSNANYEFTTAHTAAAWNAAHVQAVGNTVYEYVISEKELTAFVAAAIKNAGNASRTKLLFVDNLIYQAFSNLRSNKRIITSTEQNYQNWGLDFESFSVMGTKILVYRHDAFNYMGMDGTAFLLDPRYLEKWVFGDWSRKEYDLKELFIRNSNAVVMEEFSCWTLYYPNAHARVARPEFDTDLGVTDEVEAA